MSRRGVLSLVAVLGLVAAIAWGAMRLVRVASRPSANEPPTTRVKRGRVTITVSARGELQGGNSEMLVAPMTGVDTMPLTFLREPGELVKEGDTVVQFDSTQQEFNLREAEADLAEAEQQVIGAEAASQSNQEEIRYNRLSAQSDVKLAELEVRRNPLLAAITARQNDLALETARRHLRQAEEDVKNNEATSQAAIVIQEAALNKAKVVAETERKVIESMTLTAKTSGYVNIQPNTFTNIMYWGMQMLPFQIGDIVRPGMAVAQIPDLKSWEVSANVSELDRGHLTAGQKVSVAVVALAGTAFPGHVKAVGGTTGPPWDRHFECRIALDKAGPELRPGMSSNLVITVENLNNVTWVPSQALFESDGRTFVYRRSPGGFMPQDVTLVRRSESQAVVTGINEGEVVAMSNPDQQNKSSGQSQGALQALQQ